MEWPFSPTWAKAESHRPGFAQFYYLFDKDVRVEWERAGYAVLNHGRRFAIQVYWLMVELNNGGLEQYFWNSSGDFAEETIRELKCMGQSQAAEILQRAAVRLMGSSDMITDTNARRALIRERLGTHPFNDDDDEERLALLVGKSDLRTETRELDNIQTDVITAVVIWMRSNSKLFDHIK